MNRAVVILLLLLAGVAARGQNSATLKRSVRLDPADPVLLGHIAELSGPDAGELARVRIADADETGAWRRFEIEHVLSMIERADPEGDWGLVSVRGSACAVGTNSPIEFPSTPRATGDTDEDELPAGARVRDAVVAKLARLLGVPRADIRVSFRESDGEIVERFLLGRRPTIVPLGMSSSMPVRVRLYERTGAFQEHTIRARVEIKRRVLRLSRPVGRGEPVLPEAIVRDEAWVGPDVVPAGELDAIGSLAKRKLGAGLVLSKSDVQRPVLIKRGELVRVHCLSGSLVLESEARALQDGHEGEVIELEPTLGEGRYRATVRGRGRATIVLGQAPGEDG